MNGAENLVRTLVLVAAALLAEGRTATAAEIAVVEQRALSAVDLPRAADATHDLSLQLFTFRGTRWPPQTIVTALRQAAPLLGACGVAIVRAELRILDAPRQLQYFSTPSSRVLLRSIEVVKPALFFVEDMRTEAAFDAIAIGRANSATRPELADTVWIAYGSRDLPFVVAHELVHVLADSGEHSNDLGNLMREDTSPRNARLSAAQCARLRERGEANGLLTTRR